MAKFCVNCGAELDDDARFCSSCGSRTDAPANTNAAYVDVNLSDVSEAVYVTPNIVYCPDGYYRWYYELNMLTNPTILFTVLKVLIISGGICCLFISAMGIIVDHDIDIVIGTVKIFFIVTAVMLVLGVISYLILALIMGGKYMVLFEMDEQGVKHIQMPSQFKKAEAIGWLGVVSGLMTGNPSMVGLGIVNASKSSLSSEFRVVKSVKVNRGRNVIYVNELLNKNQVYAYKEDFPFVERFILDHCVNAKRT